MVLLKKIFDFYIKSSLHVALSAYALVTMTMYFFNISENFEVKAVLSADDLDTKFKKAKEYLENGKAIDAWKLLLAKK